MSTLNIISLLASIVVVVSILLWQRKRYLQNKQTLSMMKDLFPISTTSYSLSLNSENHKQINVSNQKSRNNNSDVISLALEINQYIEHNEGTTDFSVIQNKTERYTESIYEEATSSLSITTYIGLIGTFLGVLVGLIFFLVGIWLENDTDQDSQIKGLILGVMVSMLASLNGLWLTIKTNSRAAEAKKELDKRKNIFYDFVQNELMPLLGTSVVIALNKLKDTINTFVPAFDNVIERFHVTFDDCTKSFGNEFRENVSVVTRAVEIMSENMEMMNSASKNLGNLVEVLRTDEMANTLNSFVESVESIDMLQENIVDLEKQKRLLSKSTEKLLDAQTSYMQSLYLPESIADKLTAILDRFTTFEDSINAFGVDIAQNQMLGNNVINLIKNQIAELTRKGQVIQDYQDTTKDELQKICDEQTDNIRQLTSQYSESIAEHADKLKLMMDNVSNEITQKKKEFMSVLSDAFDVADIQTEFRQLNNLPDMLIKLGDVERALKDSSDLLEKLEDIRQGTAFVNESVGDLKSDTALTNAISDINKRQNEIDRKVEISNSNLQQSLRNLSRDVTDMEQTIQKSYTENFDSSSKSIDTSFDNLKDSIKGIAKSLADNTESSKIDELLEKVNSLDDKISDAHVKEKQKGFSLFGR